MYHIEHKRHLQRVNLDRSLAKKKKIKKYLPPSPNFENPPDEKQLCFFMRPKVSPLFNVRVVLTWMGRFSNVYMKTCQWEEVLNERWIQDVVVKWGPRDTISSLAPVPFSPGATSIHSCVVIPKQGLTDPTLNTNILNVKLWPLIIDIHSKRLPVLLANYKYKPISNTSDTHHH